jgi:hypothetical protein
VDACYYEYSTKLVSMKGDLKLVRLSSDVNVVQKSLSKKPIPKSRVFLEKLIATLVVNKFPAFYGTEFIIMFTQDLS